MSKGEKTPTTAQTNRRVFAEKLVGVLSELDDLLREEVTDSKADIPERTLNQTLVRKVHIGPLPFACRLKVIDGKAHVMVNERWVADGYFTDKQIYRAPFFKLHSNENH